MAARSPAGTTVRDDAAVLSRRPEPSGASRLVYQPGFMRGCAVLWFVLAAALAVEVVLRTPVEVAAGRLLLLAAATVVVHVVFWRPAVVVDDDAVTLRNLVRDVRVPWHLVEAVDTRFALAVLTPSGTYTSWAAPAPGRFTGGLSRQDVAYRAAIGQGDGSVLRASTAPNSDSGAAAFLVEQRRYARAAATRRAGERVEVVWQWPLIALLVLCAAAAAGALAML